MRILLMFLLQFFLLASCFANTKQFKVYVLFSYLPGIWSEGALKGVKDTLNSEGYMQNEIKHFDYDYVRMRNKLTSLRGETIKKIKSFKPDLIIVFDDEAADDFIPELNKLNIPIIATGLNKQIHEMKWYQTQGSKNRNFSGVLERYPFEEPLKILKQISPKTKKINILTTQNVSSDLIKDQFLEKFKRYNNEFSGIKLNNVLSSRRWKDWKRSIIEHTATDEAFWILVPWDVYDEEGNEVTLKEMGIFYQKNSKIPELGIVNASDLLGMLASFSINSEDLAAEAVLKGLEAIRNNKQLSLVPFETVKSARVVINKERADILKLKIPDKFLDFATIERKLPLTFFR